MSSAASLWVWGIGLAVGFPLLTILLGEGIHRLKRRGRAIASTVRLVRNVLLPILVLLVFLQHLLQVDPATRHFKTVETVFWVFVIHASLSLLNVILFEQAEADTWRSRVPKLLIDLALQDTLGSVMSGIALLFERPFTVGDWLEVGGVVGQVIDINWRAVRLLTLEQDWWRSPTS